jgi:ribosome-associated heat shock protein Hsp15
MAASMALLSQRIDRFLWFARLAASRSSAQALAERGIIRLNGRRIERAHAPVRIGDLITLPHGNSARVLRIVALPVRRGPSSEALSHYEELRTGDAGEPLNGGTSQAVDRLTLDAAPHIAGLRAISHVIRGKKP